MYNPHLKRDRLLRKYWSNRLTAMMFNVSLHDALMINAFEQYNDVTWRIGNE